MLCWAVSVERSKDVGDLLCWCRWKSSDDMKKFGFLRDDPSHQLELHLCLQNQVVGLRSQNCRSLTVAAETALPDSCEQQAHIIKGDAA